MWSSQAAPVLGLRVIEPAATLAPRVVWTVAGLVHAVSDALASRFAVCTVRGELSAFSRASSGHCYFCLKDADGESALIRCAMFKRTASMLDFSPRDGQLVELRGRLALYEPRGELQFIVEAMRPAGAGALYEQFLRLKAKLEAEGLFDLQRKRALPRFPSRVGVVTSLGAAALHDVLTALQRRARHLEVIVYPSLVQGGDAPDTLVAALQRANQRAEVDVLIVCRGGGSLEDLWSFNDERVIRAIVASGIPVVCGVGHETDVSLADFAADVRAPTPTAAAELVAMATDDCLASLAGLRGRLQRRVRQVLDSQAQRLDAAALRLSRPTRLLQRQGHLLAMLSQRLAASAGRGLDRRAQPLEELGRRLRRAVQASPSWQRSRLDMLAARLQALDPRQVLTRGYAWLADASGAPVQSVAQLTPGESLQAVLADGSARVTVDEVSPGTAG